MFALITDDHTGEELARYELADTDLLDPDLYANRYAQEQGAYSLDFASGVPAGCADITVTLQEEPGTVRCWTSAAYFIAATND